VGSDDYPTEGAFAQEAAGPRGRCRERRCLLKGCERTFRPSHPQTRYCSEACRRGAARWRRWRSARKYRESDSGKSGRRAQSRRYRERRAARWEALLREIEEEVAGAEPAPRAVQLERLEGREGQRAAVGEEDFWGRTCKRPGCYVLFVLRPGVPQQCYCSSECRKALRRVEDREAHRQARRRRRSRGDSFRGFGRSPPR
jgi:hypothetical protein